MAVVRLDTRYVGKQYADGPAGRADGLAGGVVGDPEFLSSTLSRLARKHQIPGAQLAILTGDELMTVECGELLCATGQRVAQDTVFPLGSISKVFTATLAMVLVADGDVELEVPLAEYLPELGELEVEFTLHQVLSHTSGLADPEVEADRAGDEANSAAVRRYVREHCPDLVGAPGSGFSYSSVGYAVVGHLIETITGMSWREAMDSILCRPLGIEPVFVGGVGGNAGQRVVAMGHSVHPGVGKTRPVQQSLAWAESPAGGLATSAVDLVGLARVLVGQGVPELLPVGYAKQMRHAVAGADPFGLADGWGLGLAVFREGNLDWVGHDGNADGTACYLRVEPVSGCVVALTSNANIGLVLWRELIAELRSAGLSLPSYSTEHAVGKPTPPPVGCVGSYVNGNTDYAVAVHDDGRYFLTVDGEAVAWLTFHEDLVFAQHDVVSGQSLHAGRFLTDPITGDIDRIVVNGRVGRQRLVHA